MAPAIVGLVGVIVGAMLSGALTLLTTRRSDKRQARAAGRLLESELRSIAQQLLLMRNDLARQAGLRMKESRTILRELFRLPPTVAWETHKSLLASLLTTAEWYAVAKAYES